MTVRTDRVMPEVLSEMQPANVDNIATGGLRRRRRSGEAVLRRRSPESRDVGRSTSAAILGALSLLDVRLSAAADAIKALFGPESSRVMFRGLHIKPTDVDVSLGRAPVAPLFGPLGFGQPVLPAEWVHGTRFERLREVGGLSSFDLDVLLVALAPEIDARYERLYAFIQDDVTRKCPTVDVALNLLCSSVEQKLERLGRFSSDAPLVLSGLVRLLAPDGQGDSHRLSAAIKLDEAALGFLLGHEWLDSRIAPYCTLFSAVNPTTSPGARSAAHTAVIYQRGRDLEEVLVGVRRHAGDRSILVFDTEQVLWAKTDWDSLLTVTFLTAALGGHALLIQRADLLLEGEQKGRLGQLLRRVKNHRDDIYFGGSARWESADQHTISVISLEETSRSPKEVAALWKKDLDRQGATASTEVLTRLATTFESLTAGQIGAAVVHAIRTSKSGITSPLNAPELLEGARRQTSGALRGLAERVQVAPSWDDLVLPDDTIAQLQEISLRVVHRATVMDDWGFAGKRAPGRGTAVLFSGPSGTGKTFAAAALAAELGQDLFRIDLSAVVSKYIGETEKNLSRLFDAAERADCILLFDEADALFGKRSEVRDAHDRYANQEVAYLLQRIEQFGGLAILTTNLGGAIDDAFSRRLALTVHFPIPDEAARRKLWELALPLKAPLATDIDQRLLASHFPVCGGVIAKAALAAGFIAAETGPPISMKHLTRAIRREAADLGIRLPPAGSTGP